MGDAEPAQGDDFAGLGARLDVYFLLAVERVQAELGAKGSGGHGNVQGRVKVVAVAHVRGVIIDADLYVEVTGGAAGGTGLALAAELDAGSGGHAGGNLDRQ